VDQLLPHQELPLQAQELLSLQAQELLPPQAQELLPQAQELPLQALVPLHLALVVPHLKHHQPLFLNPTPHLKLELPPHQDLDPELEPTPRQPLLNVVMELRTQVNNAREELAALTDADFTKPTDHAASDQQELPKLALERDDATDSEFADLPSLNKTPRENVRRPTEARVSVTSPPVPVSKKLLLSQRMKVDFHFYP